MTRDEAVSAVMKGQPNKWLGAPDAVEASRLVDALAALGLLKLETQDEAVRVAAIDRLVGVLVHAEVGLNPIEPVCLGQSGAAEIIDVLTMSGFKIMRDT